MYNMKQINIHSKFNILLCSEKTDRCKAQSSPKLDHKRKTHPKSLLVCCYQDMCNHADSPETARIFMRETGTLPFLDFILRISHINTHTNNVTKQNIIIYKKKNKIKPRTTFTYKICTYLFLNKCFPLHFLIVL